MTHSYWAIYSWDSCEAPALRREHLKAHLDYAARIIDKIAVGGPLREGNEPDFGSLIVLKADSEREAQAILEADPYYQAGVWERSEIRPFRPVIGEWVGGRNW
jgi:hypothetical protein